MNDTADVVVIGAGISGLAAASWLHQRGYSIHILEKESIAGGSIQTDRDQGYIIEHGPNSGLETNPVIRKLADSLGILDQMIYANEEANNRYIVRNGQLHALPMSPGKFLRTNLFSTGAKLRVLKEFFITPAPEDARETVADFVSRRLGPEFLDYAINPFVAGVFAGDPRELSVRAAFPKLVALEENYGGLFKGMITGRRERKKREAAGEESKQSARMFSFREGLDTLIEALQDQLQDAITTEARINTVSRKEEHWEVSYTHNGNPKVTEANAVLFAAPAYAVSDLIRDIDNETAAALNAIPYAKAVMIFTGYDQQAVPVELDGFGYLIPEAEQMHILGTIWTSTVFENRVPPGKVSFTTFVGGRRQPGKLELDDEQLFDEMQADFRTLMGITAEPEKVFIRRWPKAIPQYTLGHLKREARMETFENQHPGLFITGNHRGGISVADCIKHSESRANQIDSYLKKAQSITITY